MKVQKKIISNEAKDIMPLGWAALPASGNAFQPLFIHFALAILLAIAPEVVAQKANANNLSQQDISQQEKSHQEERDLEASHPGVSYQESHRQKITSRNSTTKNLESQDSNLQDVLSIKPELYLKNYSIDDGLSSSVPSAIAQTSDGYIWIGTQDGLNRFDGYEFKVFNKEVGNLSSLPSNEILSIYADDDKYLWVGTLSGVARLNTRDNRITRIPVIDATQLTQVYGIAQDAIYGRIWAATYQGLFIFDDDSQSFVSYQRLEPDAPTIPTKATRGIHALGSVLYFSQLECLYKLDLIKHSLDKKCDGSLPKTSNSLKGNLGKFDLIHEIDSNRQDQLWLATVNGLLQINLLTQTTTLYNSSNTDVFNELKNEVIEVLVDSEQNVWFATYLGIGHYDTKLQKFNAYQRNLFDKNRLLENHTIELFEDNNGLIWIGSYAAGIHIWNPKSKVFSHYLSQRHANYFDISNVVHAITTDLLGNVWVGTSGSGLFKISGDRSKVQSIAPLAKGTDLSNEVITALHFDIYDKLWIGTLDGIRVFDPETNHVVNLYNKDHPSTNRSISRIMEDRQGNIWLGTVFGLWKVSHYNGDLRQANSIKITTHNKNIKEALGDASPSIYALYEDVEGKFWVGFESGLLYLDLESDQHHFFQAEEENSQTISSNRIQSIYEDTQGTIWVGTANGLNKVSLDRNEVSNSYFIRYLEQDGLPNESIYSILSATNDALWLSTDFGIVLYDHVNKRATHYTVSDGLQSNEFNMYAEHKSSEGEIFFGGINGVTSFFPEEVSHRDMDVPLVVTEVKVDNQTVSLKSPQNEPIYIRQNTGFLAVKVAGLNYIAPQLQNYRYRVKGLNENWNELGNNRLLNISGLESGVHRLELQLTNSVGEWEGAQAELLLDVTVEFWSSRVAMVLYLLLFLMATAFIGYLITRRYRNRLASVTEELEVRQGKIRELSSNLDSTNDQLALQNQEKALIEEKLTTLDSKLNNFTKREPISQFYSRKFFEELMNRENSTEKSKAHFSSEGCLIGLHITDYEDCLVNEDFANLEAGFSELCELLRDYFSGDDLICRWEDNKIVFLESGNVEIVNIRMQNLLKILKSRTFDCGNGRYLDFKCTLAIVPVPLGAQSTSLLSRIHAAYLCSDLCDYLYANQLEGCYLLKCIDNSHPVMLERKISEGVEYLLEEKLFELCSVTESTQPELV